MSLLDGYEAVQLGGIEVSLPACILTVLSGMIAALKQEAYRSILEGVFVMVCDKGHDHLRQIQASHFDDRLEPVFVTQVSIVLQ